ncbi:MAG: beta-ketoacyl synthase N-terminal-like domain-containing protein, partial [Bacteroidia bacterium]|nr:beta-ketoacyl synthase N-terminal-like domain-containing protein [Bacteroidia bacterium]
MRVVVTAYGAISAAGAEVEAALRAYRSGRTAAALISLGGETCLAARLDKNARATLDDFVGALERRQKIFDPAAAMAAYACERAAASWFAGPDYAIVIGSARGAAGRWEEYFSDFAPGRRFSPFASPATTAGGLASLAAARLAERLGTPVTAFVVSQTCVSAAAAVATAVALIRSGMVVRALAGGAEAPLTPFTLAAMRSTGAYAHIRRAECPFPCMPLAPRDEDAMVMGEGAAVLALEREDKADVRPWARIAGVGLACE